jgi:ADP-ribose pyrophosphatase YjhB (NUDIX family)
LAQLPGSNGHSTSNPRVRVAVVVMQGDQVLLVRHRKGERTYWLLPGGGLDYGETIEECAVRELHEETGLTIAPQQFLFMSEAIAPDKSRHILNVYLLATVTGGTLTRPEEDVIEEIAWKPMRDVPELTMFPAIQPELVAAWEKGFSGGMQYLGSRWT